MKIVLLLALLTVSECSSSRVVVGQTGQNVTLPCKYDYNYYNALSVCWGRGHIPNSGCKKQLIATDGHRVLEETRTSSRYQLLGRLDEGDVSLTILNVTASDAGRYGCRVDIPGWFNDDKHHFDVTVETAADSTTASTTAAAIETSTEETTAAYTTGHMNFTGTLLTSSTSSDEAELQEGSVLAVVLVCVLFGLVALVTAGGLVFIARRWTRLNKIPQQQQQQVHSWAQFNSTSSTLHLHSRSSAVENIYQIDGGGEGGEYEYCP